VVSQLVAYMERTTDLVGVADDRGNVVYVNRAARDRLGLPEDFDRALTTDDLFPDSAFEIYYEQIRPRILLGEVWNGYLPVRGRGGEPLEMWVTIVGEVLPGGEVSWLVISARDVTEWRHIHVDPAQQATHDELTGVATRSLLVEHVDIALARARRTGSAAAVIFVDLDDLKAVNDSFGHQAGDAVLTEVARRLRDSVRAIDTVARVGGDEFVVLFDGVDDEHEAEALATRVHAILESEPIDAEGSVVNVSASVGLAVSAGNEGANQLIGRADAAMYDAKGDRRQSPVAAQREALEGLRAFTVRDVAVAVTQRAIVPYYQAVVEVTTERVVGFHALARWLRADGTPLPAVDFVDVVEGSGVSFSLDLAILRHAAAELAPRTDGATVYAHVSSRFLTRPGVARFVTEVLDRATLDPHRLALVVPAPLVENRAVLVGPALSALRDVEVGLVLDLSDGDVGRLPEHDDLFAEVRLTLNPDGRRHLAPKLLRPMIDAARARDVRTLVVGVETAEQLDSLRELGVDRASGRWFSGPHRHPLPPDGRTRSDSGNSHARGRDLRP
jgi:diguanylate cyclase (GGDEF)-like protein/PAS domain S-box-containing protein